MTEWSSTKSFNLEGQDSSNSLAHQTETSQSSKIRPKQELTSGGYCSNPENGNYLQKVSDRNDIQFAGGFTLSLFHRVPRLWLFNVIGALERNHKYHISCQKYLSLNAKALLSPWSRSRFGELFFTISAFWENCYNSSSSAVLWPN